MKKTTIVHRLTRLALSVALLSAGNAHAGWLTAYGTSDDDIGAAIPSARGGFYVTLVAGSISSVIGLPDMTGSTTKPSQLLSLVDANGAVQWTNKIGTGGYDTFFASELTDGRLLVQGITQATRTAQTDAVWAMYNVNRATGQMNPVFRNIYKTKGYDQFFISQDEHGTLWAQGSTVANADSNIIVAKISATTGLPEWSSVLHYAKDDSLAAFMPKGDQFILVSNAGTTSNQSVLIGLLTNRGLPVADSFKKYGTSGINGATGLKAIADGNYLLYGTISTPNAAGQEMTAVFVAKLDANLKMLWSKKYSAGKDTSLIITEVNENDDGSLTLSGSTTTTPEFSLDSPLALSESHPAIIRLSAAGLVQSSKSFKLNDMDSAFFFKNVNGGYALGGQTTMSSAAGFPDLTDLSNLDLTNLTDLTDMFTNSNTDLLYGAFNANFVPSWVKTVGDTGMESGSVIPTAGHYTLTGLTSSWGAGESDILVGELDNNGTIAGCAAIKNAKLKETRLTITASNLGWTAQAANPVRKGGISATRLTTLNTSATHTITATPVCR